ncbi:hypothetical protein DY218_14195 [Streptomyces triticagri]|uniref:DUF7224 domain-containing protein n=1 Tax=Streptomyces triticagri TaxID=2293568 RepID=A0A372M6H3_9ACTN|nr:hypothetical protein [Streptomyces triticagri]RFU86053.1 hypothetical protein DY218_14195 [Streptomyces triticagri]
MRVKTLLRTGSGVWVGVLLIAGLLFFSSGNTDTTIAYWGSITAQSTLLLPVVGAVCGAAAAWESARLRESGVAAWAPVRGELRIVGQRLAPLVVDGLLGIVVALGLFTPGDAFGLPGGPDAAVLVTAVVVLLGHLAAGYLVGRWLPKLLGPALMLVGGYFWGFWPAALAEPSWLRHLNGQGVGDCCRLDQEPSLRSLGATAAFSAGLVVAAVIVVVLRRTGRRRLVATAASLTGLACAIALAVPLGFGGEQARDRALLQCTGSRPQVCLWPEQQGRASEFRRWVKDADRKVRAVGVGPAERIEFAEPVPSRESVLVEAATSGVRLDPPACAERPYATYPGDEAALVIHPWLALTAGVAPDALLDWPSESVRRAEEVRRLPADAQAAWFARNMRSVRDCSVKPDLSPAAYAHRASS